MSAHRVAVFVGDRQTRVAGCSCGWESTPTLSSFKAEQEGQEHQRRQEAAAQATQAADRGES